MTNCALRFQDFDRNFLFEDSISNFRLLIVGYGSEKEHLQNFINKFHLKKYVKIIFAKNPYKFIKMSDVFISSSKFEGLPNVLLEAAYLNKYIISSNCKTGPKEIIKRYILSLRNF